MLSGGVCGGGSGRGSGRGRALREVSGRVNTVCLLCAELLASKKEPGRWTWEAKFEYSTSERLTNYVRVCAVCSRACRLRGVVSVDFCWYSMNAD